MLPLKNISPDPKDEYFADGLTEEFISAISKVRELSVISSTSAMQYKSRSKPVVEIGRELNAGTILEGSVRKAGNRVRITVQMIDAKHDKHEWAESYDRELQDVFAIQSDIAQKVTESMKVNLLESERVKIERVPTKNVSAYEDYLRGVYLAQGPRWTSTDSIKHFEEAIGQDPAFSLAYAALGNLYVALAGETVPPRQAFEKAEPLIKKAIELDENSSDAHLAKGNLAFQYYLDWQQAETEFRKAIDLNPSNASAHFWHSLLHLVTGRLEEAMKEATVAHQLDPLSLFMQHGIVGCLFVKRAYFQAAGLLERMVQLEPDNAHYRLFLAYSYCLAGKLEEAEKEAEAIRRLNVISRDKILLARVHALLGKRDEARSLLRDIETERRIQYYSLTNLASVYVALGEKEKALDMMEEEFEEDRASFLFNYWLPEFDPVRQDPRFISLHARLNLPKEP